MNSEGVLSDQERMDIIKGSVGRFVEEAASKREFKIRDGGDVVLLVIVVGGRETSPTSPTAVIRKVDGAIVERQAPTEYIDQILLRFLNRNLLIE